MLPRAVPIEVSPLHPSKENCRSIETTSVCDTENVALAPSRYQPSPLVVPYAESTRRKYSIRHRAAANFGPFMRIMPFVFSWLTLPVHRSKAYRLPAVTLTVA